MKKNPNKLNYCAAKILIPLFILAEFFVSPVKAEWASHLVISEIQIAGVTTDDEFIELYNPTAQETNLTGYSLKKKAKTGTESALVTDGYFQDIIIKPHNYLLLARKEYYQGSVSPGIEWPKSYSLSSDNTIILYSDQGIVIDKVGWGKAVDFEGATFPDNPLVGQSLERKAGADSTADSLASGADEYLGNGWDSGNNSADFALRTVSGPQNSSSSAEPALENPETGSARYNNGDTPSPTIPAPAAKPSLPAAEAGSDKEAAIGEAVSFDGSDSFDPGNGELSYIWYFGDGAKASGENVSHIFSAAGEYKVILKISAGDRGAEDAASVKIIEPEFSDKVVLSEILPNPEGADKDGEWIELFNSGDKKINLLGWILDDETGGGGKPYSFSNDNFIKADGFLVVKRSQSKLVLKNTGGEVNLSWYNGKVLSRVSYGEAKEGKSYAFVNNGWQWSENPSSGRENIGESGIPKASKAVKSAGKIIAAEDSEGETTVSGRITRTVQPEFAIRGAESGSRTDESENFSLENKESNNERAGLAPELLLGAEAGRIDALPTTGEKTDSGLKEDSEPDAKNNPWFWGDMALGALSLFLVWRYQEVKKKIKQ